MAILLATADLQQLFFDSASDLAKQLIAVSTGIIGLSITFLKDVVTNVAKPILWLLRLAWVAYLFSTVFGFLTLMAVTGSIRLLLGDPNSPPVTGNVAFYAGIQIILFFLATLLLVIYGICAIPKFWEKHEAETSKPKVD